MAPWNIIESQKSKTFITFVNRFEFIQGNKILIITGFYIKEYQNFNMWSSSEMSRNQKLNFQQDRTDSYTTEVK